MVCTDVETCRFCVIAMTRVDRWVRLIRGLLRPDNGARNDERLLCLLSRRSWCCKLISFLQRRARGYQHPSL